MRGLAIVLMGGMVLAGLGGCDSANSKEGEDCTTAAGMAGHFSANGYCSTDEIANSPES